VAEIEYDKQSPIGNFSAPELNKLYILEWFCGNGIGYQLLNMTENIIKTKGYNKIWLWVWDLNTRAIEFYLRQNYQIIGSAPFAMEQNTYTNWVMIKDL
jgi:ribosomal protein S18 acetylase RimI-like enzyme